MEWESTSCGIGGIHTDNEKLQQCGSEKYNCYHLKVIEIIEAGRKHLFKIIGAGLLLSGVISSVVVLFFRKSTVNKNKIK